HASSAAARCSRAAAPTPPSSAGPVATTPESALMDPRSERVEATLTRTHPDHLVDRGDPDLAVADLAGTGGVDDRVDHLLHIDLGDEHVDADLGQELDGVLGTSVDLGVALLPAVPLDLADGHAGHAHRMQRFLHRVELMRLDHRRHKLHAQTLH